MPELSANDLKSRLRADAQGATGLAVAYIGVVNDLFSALDRLGATGAASLAAATGNDPGYVARWCDAAYAFGYLDEADAGFRLTDSGAALRPEAAGTLMPIAVQAMLSAHMAERAAALMRSGERPGEQVVAAHATLLPWFGPMLEASYAGFFADTICPAVPIFREVDARGGLAVDLGCGNGWYLRALAARCPALHGLGLDGFAENITQARRLAEAAGLADRLRFEAGDIHDFGLAEPADLIAMNRALHHVWEAGPERLLARLHDNLRPAGAAVFWEPNWPAERARLRSPAWRRMAFQNLTEYVQGNHLLGAEEIAATCRRAAFTPEIHLFADGLEAVIVARR